MEQPPVSPEDVKKESPAVERESNIIRGPWPERNVSGAEARPFAAVPVEERPSNVIEGPWQPTPEREGKITELKEELQKLDAQPKQEGDRQDNGNKKVFPYTEGYTEFRQCEACGGSGRRWFFLSCPACQGLGSIPARSSTASGYYESAEK